MTPKKCKSSTVGSGVQTLHNQTTDYDGGAEKFIENFVKEDPEEIFGDAAGSSPRVLLSNTPSIRDEHQPSIMLSDCPPDTVQMVGRKEGNSGSGG